MIPSNSSTNPLPLSIKIGGYCFGKNLDITLTKKTGSINLVKSKVYTQENGTLNVTISPTNNLVSVIATKRLKIRQKNITF